MDLSRDILCLVYAELQSRFDALRFRCVCKRWKQLGHLTEPMRKKRFPTVCNSASKITLGYSSSPIVEKCTEIGEHQCGRCINMMCENHASIRCVRCQSAVCQQCCIDSAPACLACVKRCEDAYEICSMAGPRGCSRRPWPLIANAGHASQFLYCTSCDRVVCPDCFLRGHALHPAKRVMPKTLPSNEDGSYSLYDWAVFGH